MHAFGSLQYVNSTVSHAVLEEFPESVAFTSFGMLIIRGIGCLLLQLTVDERESHVKLLHEGGTLSIVPALKRLTTLHYSEFVTPPPLKWTRMHTEDDNLSDVGSSRFFEVIIQYLHVHVPLMCTCASVKSELYVVCNGLA